MNELERITSEYQASQGVRSKVWTSFNPVSVYYWQEYEFWLLAGFSTMRVSLRLSPAS